MKFKIKTTFTEGELRVVRRFAWLPVATNNAWVWLEAYEVLQRLYGSTADTSFWLDLERRSLP